MQKSDRTGEKEKRKVVHITNREREKKLIKYNRILFGGIFVDLRGNVFLNNMYVCREKKKLQKNRYISRITKK